MNQFSWAAGSQASPLGFVNELTSCTVVGHEYQVIEAFE
jgi:hypothetical protein